MHPFEQRLAIEMAERLLLSIRRQTPKGAQTFAQFFFEQAGTLGLDLSVPDDEDPWETIDRPGLLDACRVAVRKRLDALADAKPGELVRRLALVARIFGLSDAERDLLGLLHRVQADEAFEEMFDRALSVVRWDERRVYRLAVATGLQRRAVAGMIDTEGRLCRCGLVGTGQRPEPTEMAGEILKAPDLNEAGLIRLILGRRAPAELDWTDFDHMEAERDRIASVLRAAVERKEKAVHILLYGPPGSGKSQLARTVAARLGLPVHPVGEADAHGDELNRKERLGAYRMAQMLSNGLKACALVVDEADDILGGAPWSASGHAVRTAGSKAHLHRLLETTGTPTIWTTNAEAWIDPAILRRMTYVVEVRRPAAASLARLWQRVTAKCDIHVTAEQARDLAETYPVAPGLVTGAIRLAELSGGGYADLEAGVAAIAKVTGQARREGARRSAPVPFDPGLAVADADLPALCARLAAGNAPAVSFCLYGAPGTGKSAFARHLAETLKLRFMQKRASDLVDKYIGETEKRIAAAFREAREEGALLMFDEADSMLMDRANATRSWEVSHVNEMLTWMEDHPLPFVCATNLMDRLDPAALRRFVFKIRFDWLDRDRARHAFRRFFALEPPPALDRLERLAPGDFAVVARKAKAMGWSGDGNRVTELLAEEEQAKPGYRNPLGFA
jgi:transitional endoplasmic reticulum ATPase